MVNQPVPRSVFIAVHPFVHQAAVEARDVVQMLQDGGLHVVSGTFDDEAMRARVRAREFDMVVVMGGDGTMLRAGHLCAPLDIPVLGINMGHFGFLYELQRADWMNSLPLLLQGDYWLERRMMMRAAFCRGASTLGQWEVLNDVVVCRGQYVRPVQLRAFVNGGLFASYVADGLIASTATGSTAYALAAGGPILPPDLRNILMVPVAPHLSVDRAVVLAEGAAVTIEVVSANQAVLSVDGQPPIVLDNGDHVEVTSSAHSLPLVRFQDPGYFYRNLTSHMEQNPLFGASK